MLMSTRTQAICTAVLICLLIALTGCGGTGDQSNIKKTEQIKAADTADKQQTKVDKPDKSPNGEQLKIIKTASVTIETNNLEKIEQQILSLVNAKNGKVDKVSINVDSKGGKYGNYTLRVPQEQLDELIKQIDGLPDCIVNQKNLDLQDVTEQYIDINARLENLQRQEVRLREILAKAGTVEEILKIENELTRIRTQIEIITAKLKNLASSIELSTLQLTIRQPGSTGWSNYGHRLAEAFRDGVEGAGNLSLGLVTIILGSLPAIIAFVLVWKLWKWYKGKSAK